MKDDDYFALLMINSPEQLAERAITDIELFRKMSERAIVSGYIEPLSREGFIQAVENLAYQMTLLAFGGALEAASEEHIAEQASKLDNILVHVAYASGRHFSEIDRMLGPLMEKYQDEILEKYRK